MEALTQRQALIVLNGLPHIGPVVLRRLMEAFGGDAVAVLQAETDALARVKGVGRKVADTLANWPAHFDLKREERNMAKHGTAFVTWTDGDYPELLKETYDPPIGLYWQGAYRLDRPCVAIVGTRRATLYGRKITRELAGGLARVGFCIVSGMARGTDTAAHEGALEVGGKTVAVFGCGLDIIYPPENFELYKRVTAEGAVLSEFPFGRRADRQSFPMRNRVVAGMCQGILVVESGVAGGSMITARFAGEQGRAVMAVPGRVDQAGSAGCHQLIRDGATLVTSVDDVLEELRYPAPREQELGLEAAEDAAERGPPAAAGHFSEAEARLMEALAGGNRMGPDALSEQTGHPVSEIGALLMGLELKRAVVKHADGTFEAP